MEKGGSVVNSGEGPGTAGDVHDNWQVSILLPVEMRWLPYVLSLQDISYFILSEYESGNLTRRFS